MTAKADFTEEEWNVVREVQPLLECLCLRQMAEDRSARLGARQELRRGPQATRPESVARRARLRETGRRAALQAETWSARA